MSNWNGIGTPENGQWLSAGSRARVQFVGVNSLGDWVVEDESHSLHTYRINFFKPIKTPEQVEREKAIYGAEAVIKKAFGSSVDNADYSAVIQVLIEAGYHNQEKVKATS